MSSAIQQLPPPAVAPAPPTTHSAAAVVVKLTVTVPQGISGGDLVRVAAPDGSYHSIMVPNGLSSGQQFSVELLATSSSTSASAAEVQRLRMELDAERVGGEVADRLVAVEDAVDARHLLGNLHAFMAVAQCWR